jgi:hypothetical protein
MFDRLSQNPWLKRTDVGGDIRQFRHVKQLAGRNGIFQPRNLR